MEGGQDVGYSQGQISAGSGGTPGGNELHRKKIGDGGTLGVAAANIWKV